MTESSINVYRLIELVRQRPVLYNEFLPEYHRYRQRQRAWNEVSKIMKQPVDKCQYKWRALRSQYNSYLRRKMKKPTQQTSTQYGDELKFLDEFLQRKRKSKSNERELEDGDDNDNDEEVDDDEGEDEEVDDEDDEKASEQPIDDDQEAEDEDEDDSDSLKKSIPNDNKSNEVSRLLQEIYDKQQERLRNFYRRPSPFVSHFSSSTTTTTASTTIPAANTYQTSTDIIRKSRTPSISRYDQWSNEEEDDDEDDYEDDDYEESMMNTKYQSKFTNANLIEDMKIWTIFLLILAAFTVLIMFWPYYLTKILRIG